MEKPRTVFLAVLVFFGGGPYSAFPRGVKVQCAVSVTFVVFAIIIFNRRKNMRTAVAEGVIAVGKSPRKSFSAGRIPRIGDRPKLWRISETISANVDA